MIYGKKYNESIVLSIPKLIFSYSDSEAGAELASTHQVFYEVNNSRSFDLQGGGGEPEKILLGGGVVFYYITPPYKILPGGAVKIVVLQNKYFILKGSSLPK